MSRPVEIPGRPAWSVIVPTHDRPSQLARCLAALARLEPPAGGFEAIVVNDGGAEPDDRLRRDAAAGTAARIRFASQPHAGPGAARNHGAKLAAGDWLAFTDDDCEPAPGWLTAFERALVERPDALAGGGTVNALADSTFSEASQLLAGFVAGWFDGTGRERFFTSNNIALARSAFFAAGAFDARFGTAAGEDREFCDRWSAQGRASVDVADAVVHHAHVLSLRSFLRQHFGYGGAARLFRQARRNSGRSVRIEPSFYIASVRHAGRVRPVVRGAVLAGWTMVAHAAYLAGLAREAAWRDLGRPPEVPGSSGGPS
jgi:glycosyltransferase involved in cell wall biosynthesis